MSTRRFRRAVTLALVLVLGACAAVPQATNGPAGSAGAAPPGGPSRAVGGGPTAPGSTTPAPGHELYGFLPYWEMDDPGIADHVASLPLTTLALFSVTHTGKGAINEKTRGYGLLTGDVGREVIAAAHRRGSPGRAV